MILIYYYYYYYYNVERDLNVRRNLSKVHASAVLFIGTCAVCSCVTEIILKKYDRSNVFLSNKRTN